MIKQIKYNRVLLDFRNFLYELHALNHGGLIMISYYFGVNDTFSIIDIHYNGNIRVAKSVKSLFSGLDDEFILEEVSNFLECFTADGKYKAVWMITR